MEDVDVIRDVDEVRAGEIPAAHHDEAVDPAGCHEPADFPVAVWYSDSENRGQYRAFCSRMRAQPESPSFTPGGWGTMDRAA